MCMRAKIIARSPWEPYPGTDEVKSMEAANNTVKLLRAVPGFTWETATAVGSVPGIIHTYTIPPHDTGVVMSSCFMSQ
jgi:hypothetical protein